MTTVRHLQIQGMRSFGVQKGEEQIITFKAPLTLILGENGSGKTTIIECLKYAVTGDHPPGTGIGGQQFVHDLKLAGQPVVLGQVRLEVRDVFDKKTTITRSIRKEAKGKQGKIQCQTIDSAISIVTPEGEKIQKSLRSGDATIEMCRAMGVSKAILNNVIFCHQEDSCWPFSSDKELKEKFDQIFGTAEYIKAVDRLVKQRKDMFSDLKAAKVSLEATLEFKKDADRLKAKLQGNEANFEKYKVEYAELEEKLAPLKEKLLKMREQEIEYSKIYNQKVKVDTELKQLRKREDACRKKIRELFEGDIASLKQTIEDFEHKSENSAGKKKEAEADVKLHTAEVKKIDDRVKELERKLARLQTEKEQEQETLAKRAEEVRSICERFTIPIEADIENDNSAAVALIQKVKDALKLQEDEVNQTVKNNEDAETAMQTKIDELREQKARTDADVVAKRKQHRQVSDEKSKMATDVAKIEASQSQVEDLLGEIKKFDEELEGLKAEINIEEQHRQIAEKSAQATALQDEIESLDAKITDLRELSRQLNELAYKDKEIKKYEDSYATTHTKHSENLKRFFGEELPESGFKQKVSAKQRQFQRELDELNQKIKATNNKVVELKTTRKSQRDRNSKMERELKDAEDALFNVCGDDDYEELVAKSREKISKLQLEFGANKSSEAMFKKYISQVKEDPHCPLCTNPLEEERRTTLATELEEKINHLPDEIKTTEKLLKAEQKALDQLQKLRSKVDTIQKLKPEIKALEEQSKVSEDELKQLQTELDDFELMVVEPTDNAKVSNAMLPDMAQLDTLRSQIDRLKKEVEKLKASLPADHDSTANQPDELVKQKLEKQKQVKLLRQELEQNRNLLDKKSKQLADTTEKRNTLMKKQIELQEGAISLPEKKQRLEDLTNQREQLEAEILTLSRSGVEFKQQLDAANKEKKELKDKNNQGMKALRKKFADSTSMFQSLQRLNENVLEFARRDLDTAMSDVKKDLEMRNEELDLKRKQVTHHQDKLNELKEQIANYDNKRRDLQENLDLKQIEEEITVKAKEFGDLEVETEKTNYKELKKEQDAAKKEEDALVSKRSNIGGKKSQLAGQIADQEKELKKPKYRDAYRNYYKAFHFLKVQEKILSDLDLYRVALEYALTKFHQEKMAQINQSIRGLWREIYRGNDIDYVEIKAEEPNVSAGSKRRNYEYRVVQCKNGTELDMRGRCSAGQKVLASLIIRMALSETFSADCKVMTLDEPTTNLDQQNIVSLCDSISKILDDRGKYGFMLIIITHDEKFLQTLAQFLSVGYRVYRDINGKSIISSVS